MKLISLAQYCVVSVTGYTLPPGHGGGGGGGGGLYVLRGPQSVQSVPSLHQAAEEPAPPSSQMPFEA